MTVVLYRASIVQHNSSTVEGGTAKQVYWLTVGFEPRNKFWIPGRSSKSPRLENFQPGPGAQQAPYVTKTEF